MKRTAPLRWRLPALLIAVAVMASPLHAACYADYKAKQDNPLRLHYGVIKVPDRACSKDGAARVITRRIAADGWQLLTVLGVFDDGGLAARRDSAGQFYLRY